jgi:hypothetical protein
VPKTAEGEIVMTKNEKMELAQIIASAVVTAMQETPTSGKKSTGRGNATATKTETRYSTALKDYEPKKGADGHYIWGRKTDTVKSRNYLAMQKAYCYAVATKGQAISSNECYKLGIEVDYDKSYNKAKADFKKKYVYVAKGGRN